jgi:glutaconyl-CoA decarboxylase
MKKYRINVNGNTYEVEVEEIGGAAGSIAPPPIAKSVPAAPPKAPAAAPAAPAQQPKKDAPAAGAGTITAPMQGKIVSVEVGWRQYQGGYCIIILEA